MRVMTVQSILRTEIFNQNLWSQYPHNGDTENTHRLLIRQETGSVVTGEGCWDRQSSFWCLINQSIQDTITSGMAAWQTPQRRRQQNNNKQPVGTQGGLQGERGRREVNCYSLAVSLETIKQPYGWLTQCGVPTTRLYSSVRHASVCHSVEHNAWLPSKDPNIRTGGDCWQQRLWNSVWNHQTTHHHQNIIKSLLTQFLIFSPYSYTP